jgi:hypothetical protein
VYGWSFNGSEEEKEDLYFRTFTLVQEECCKIYGDLQNKSDANLLDAYCQSFDEFCSNAKMIKRLFGYMVRTSGFNPVSKIIARSPVSTPTLFLEKSKQVIRA